MKKIEIEKLNNNIEEYIINNLTKEEVEKYNLLKSKFLIYPHIYIINYTTGGSSVCYSSTLSLSFGKTKATYAENIEHFKNRIVDSVKNYINSINYNIYNKEAQSWTILSLII